MRRSVVKRLLVVVLGWFSVSAPVLADLVSAKQAEQWLLTQQHRLLKGSEFDHVVSYYYFGHYKQRTLIGLERVRGEDYQSHFSLLIFEQGELLGFYQSVKSLPASLNEDGTVQFPPRFALAKSQGELNLGRAESDFTALCLADFVPCSTWQRHEPNMGRH